MGRENGQASGVMIPQRLLETELWIMASPAERGLIATVWTEADAGGEGRCTALPAFWAKALNLGSPQEADAALGHLEALGLIRLYEAGGRPYLVNVLHPMRARKYYAKSKAPLPPDDILAEHPDYLDFLRRLSSKHRDDFKGTAVRRGFNYYFLPRYPELWEQTDEQERKDGWVRTYSPKEFNIQNSGGKLGEVGGSGGKLGELGGSRNRSRGRGTPQYPLPPTPTATPSPKGADEFPHTPFNPAHPDLADPEPKSADPAGAEGAAGPRQAEQESLEGLDNPGPAEVKDHEAEVLRNPKESAPRKSKSGAGSSRPAERKKPEAPADQGATNLHQQQPKVPPPDATRVGRLAASAGTEAPEGNEWTKPPSDDLSKLKRDTLEDEGKRLRALGLSLAEVERELGVTAAWTYSYVQALGALRVQIEREVKAAAGAQAARN